jgi:CheY-like chemotaxis protein
MHRLEENAADFVILDLELPDRDGFALIETTRQDPRFRQIPILLMTGKNLTPDDWEQLDGHIQVLTMKGTLTSEKLSEYLGQMGLCEDPAGKDSREITDPLRR